MREQYETQAIFESTGQAVHVAFMILAEDVQQDCMLRKALIRTLESFNLQPQFSDWLAQLRGMKSETVHFDGMDGFDIRGQCAMIYAAVCTKLPNPEKWALQAKYCRTDYEGPKENRRYAFSIEKANAIRSLSDWISVADSFGTVPRLAIDCMVAKYYAHHSKTQISFRELAKTFGGSHMIYSRAWPKVRGRLRPLEEMALARLEPYFIEKGIVTAQ